MALEISLDHARVHYGPLEALHGVDLRIPSGRLTLLLGRNGSGRSTVLHALSGTVPLSAGRVLWHGGASGGAGEGAEGTASGAGPRDITRWEAYRRARLGICLVPSGRAVFPSLTVGEQLGLAGRSRKDAALALFPELARLLGRTAGRLSGGEQQMLALARALAGPARLLLLDEPGRGLAEPVVARLHAALAAAVADGRTVVLAGQALPPGPVLPDLVWVLRQGAVVFAGEPERGAPAAAGDGRSAAP
ncbi:ATP-binding cassette domain-containing protein [Streptacidiphilus sp. PB12-B1b]|uniref:ATP-binding cassette domain-containing protein n=1 Tax=Streptacidiphilus sp. PB12-B1b TaxID=2705012 RepID=UPI0015F93F5E|nr:ATP-binding cassette domain-containing protein [Streptacidiphilus sp. PB12-B1b]QMU78457.1 ATP-binding cassette domain-containing protein [Streptacidiphilus sp. PB12-B1b]